MNIGFIGAGKVGFSLGKYLTERNVRVTGYYSRNPDSSREAADFTNTRQYMNLRHLVEDSDVLFVAIPDSAVEIDTLGECRAHASRFRLRNVEIDISSPGDELDHQLAATRRIIEAAYHCRGHKR